MRDCSSALLLATASSFCSAADLTLMTPRFLTALPVYNEQSHLTEVLATVRRYAPHILVVDDGSTDATPELLRRESGIQVVTHSPNRGYGAALKSAFEHWLPAYMAGKAS